MKIPDLAVFTATPAVASVNRMSTYRLTGGAESGWAPVTYVAVSIDEAPGPRHWRQRSAARAARNYQGMANNQPQREPILVR